MAIFAGFAMRKRGDLITWPGHVGIVLDSEAAQLLQSGASGLQAEDYLGRIGDRAEAAVLSATLVVDAGSDVETAKVARPAPPSGTSSSRKKQSGRNRSAFGSRESKPEPDSRRSYYALEGGRSPRRASNRAVGESIPSSILITPEQRRPTVAEALNGISKLSNGAANALRSTEPLNVKMPIVIFDELQVERVETKRDKGWAHVQIDSHVRIAGEGTDFKRRREKWRWSFAAMRPVGGNRTGGPKLTCRETTPCAFWPAACRDDPERGRRCSTTKLSSAKKRASQIS